MIDIRDDLIVKKEDGIFCYHRDASFSDSDLKEITFWENDPLESPDGHLFDNIVNKSNFIKLFKVLMPELDLQEDETILEIGGGHCWASALVKREYPNCYVIASDLSPAAVSFVKKYEVILGVQVDEKWAFNCRHTPFKDQQFDRIFTFAAFHHFGVNSDFRPVIEEMLRVLKPDGKIMLLFEPSTPKFFYRWAHKRVNRKRENVDEDVLVLSKLDRVCKKIGVRLSFRYFPDYSHRAGILETLYYYMLSHFKFLYSLLPCTVNITISQN